MLTVIGSGSLVGTGSEVGDVTVKVLRGKHKESEGVELDSEV